MGDCRLDLLERASRRPLGTVVQAALPTLCLVAPWLRCVVMAVVREVAVDI